jgi:chaperonin cofactor prefoldin
MIVYLQTETEVQTLQRRNQMLEEERDQVEMRLRSTQDKLHEATKVVDEFER